jgi:arylsulfatase A-like enzyme
MPERPNILLIVFDTARADAFEPFGASPGSSPAFADLATRGFAHDAAYANASWTVPSHASLFTGLLPADVGLLQAPGSRPEGCRPELQARSERLLQAVLGGAGYRTGAVSSNLWISPHAGFDLEFESFTTVDTRRQTQMSEDSLPAKLRWLVEGVRADVDDGAHEAGLALESFLDAGAGDERPFFCFVNLVEAHSPYLPPLPYNPLGVTGRARAAIEARRHLTMGEIWRACAGGFDVPAQALARMRRLYAGAVRLLDDWLGRVLEDLDRRGILDETIVVVTSDHGENFGEGGLMGHAYSLDERLIRLPFAAAGPLMQPDGPFTLASLPQILCDAAGAGDHPYSRAPGEEDGLAVAQFDPPAGPGDPRVGKALELWGLEAEAGALITAELRSVTGDGRWKLVDRDGVEELFDLDADPLELDPIDLRADGAGDPEEAPLAAMRKALAAAEGPPAGAGPPKPEAADAVPPPSGEISDEERAKLEERMKLLGYL